MAHSLRRSYWHYVADPKVYNTVPGQFSEWSDGQTLVNRGMRLSPWEAPRFLWAAIDGALGLQIDGDAIELEPHLPPDWQWLRVQNLPLRGRRVSCFLTRQSDGLHLYTCETYAGALVQHRYAEELAHGVEALTTGLSLTAFRQPGEVLICLGNSLETPILGPFLAHHALDAGARYRVARLHSHDARWQDVGVLDGCDVQRATIRMEPLGYALYRFCAVPASG
jgi:hypothetical protein